jgi:hypothetical protein
MICSDEQPALIARRMIHKMSNVIVREFVDMFIELLSSGEVNNTDQKISIRIGLNFSSFNEFFQALYSP